MSQEPMKLIPKDIYKKILLNLDPNDLLSVCETEEYAYNICQDDYFWYQYIKRYDSLLYGYNTWQEIKWKEINNLAKITWKDLFINLIYPNKIIQIIITNVTKKDNPDENHSFYIAIHIDDTINNIENKINFITSVNYPYLNFIDIKIYIGDDIYLDFYYKRYGGYIILIDKLAENIHARFLSGDEKLNDIIYNDRSIFDSLLEGTIEASRMR